MIQSFADDTTVDLFRERNTRRPRRLPRSLWRIAQRNLKALDVAARLDDLDFWDLPRPADPQGAVRRRPCVNATRACERTRG